MHRNKKVRIKDIIPKTFAGSILKTIMAKDVMPTTKKTASTTNNALIKALITLISPPPSILLPFVV